jgi:hypothetical protein
MYGGLQVARVLLPRGNWAYWPVATLKIHTQQAGFGASDAYRPKGESMMVYQIRAGAAAWWGIALVS